MKVILLEDIIGTGRAGDVVEVKTGYARNKLLPSGIAIEANKTNMKTLEHRRAQIAAKKAADKEIAQEFAAVIEGKQVDFMAKAGDSGKLFGSITAHDIAEAVHKNFGYEIDRRKLLLDSPLKEVGMHTVRYRIFSDVEAVIMVNITSESAPTLPEARVLRDTYSDEALEADEDVFVMARGIGEDVAKAAETPAAEEPAEESAEEPAEESTEESTEESVETEDAEATVEPDDVDAEDDDPDPDEA
ncbi:MAG: 50S ribosomal protein L9 [Clostridiales bacterium]|nr:50S ribosomal protein L9 [Clostridiales bacterium]